LVDVRITKAIPIKNGMFLYACKLLATYNQQLGSIRVKPLAGAMQFIKRLNPRMLNEI
jgi:hypothetical protein